MAEVIDPALATAGTPCNLGPDPSKHLEKFEDWFEHTNLLIDAIGVKDGKQQLKLMLLWGGKDLRKFSREADVSTAEEGDTLTTAVNKIRTKFGRQVNLTMAIYKLMHAKQGSKPFSTFAKEVEDLAVQCQFESNPYTLERACKDAIIFGTSDDKLRQEALAKDFDLDTLRKAAQGYEQSRKNCGQMKIPGEDTRCIYTKDEVDQLIARVAAGKYSTSKAANKDSKPGKCPNCPTHYRPHEPSRCPARGKTCVVCKSKNHFAGSKNC